MNEDDLSKSSVLSELFIPSDGELKRQLCKFVQSKKRFMLLPARDLCIPDISDSSRTVHTIFQVVHIPATSRLVDRSKYN